MVAGGAINTTGTPSPNTETLKGLLRQLKSSTEELPSFSADNQSLLKQYSVKRGNAKEPFRIEERVERAYTLTSEGQHVAKLCRPGATEEISQLTPDMLKDGHVAQQTV